MGREWLYKSAASGGGGGTSPSTRQSMNKKSKRERNNSSSSSSSGCMTAFFKLFDIQNHQFRFHHPSFISESAINNNPQGVEAPRNSLQSPESVVVTPPPRASSSKNMEQSNLNIPMGGMQIKTKRSRLTEVDLSSECSSSPGTKTPNLVARLMGLDLLPEYSSPRQSASSTPATTSHHRTRSLPATPRTSTTSRRSTDKDYHHRLSLQIDNKENCNTTCRSQERRRSELPVKRQDHEERSKQIANQVRERISRRLGTDITNTITRNNNEQRRDSNLVLLKPKKQQQQPAHAAPAVKAKRDDSVTLSSSSPKLRLLDINNNLNRPVSYSQQPKLPATKSASFSASVRNTTHDQTPLAKKCNKIESERYDLRLKKEVFVNKISSLKKKSTPLRNHVVNVTNNTTKFLSFKKEMMTSSSSTSSTTRLPQKQVSLVSMTQLPSSSSISLNLNSSSYNNNSNDTSTLNLFSVKDSTTATSSSATTTAGRLSSDHHHFDDYISRIITHCGIQTTTPISTVQWHSPTHPLHPSIFHHLEKKLSHPTATATATATAAGERRMVFELVDEFLVEILKHSCSGIMCGSQLIGKLCEKMRSFPAAKCEVLEDIDGLIERDIGRSMRRLLTAEAEEIATEIEGEIMEKMVDEMAMAMGGWV